MHIHHTPCGFRSRRPSKCLLSDSVVGFVITVQREESAELHPPCTELHICVTIDAARPSTELWDASYAEGQRLGYDRVHVVQRELVSPTQRPAIAPEPSDVERAIHKGFSPRNTDRSAL